MIVSPKQLRFVNEYLVDLNATQAAVRAGYSPRTARQQAADRLAKPNIDDAVTETQRQRAERLTITQDAVVQALARIAFADIRRLFDSDGNPLTAAAVAFELRAAIAILNVDPSTGRYQVRLHDKLRALELLGKHLGMFREAKITTAPSITIDAAKVATMTDEELARGLSNVDKLIAALSTASSSCQ